MAVSKQPTIPSETSSVEGLDEEGTSRGEAKWKRFHPFRVVRKIFRRRIKREGTSVSDTSKKSWSTSELQSVQDDSTGKRDITSPLKIGLSVSHDSIFSPENGSSNVGSESLDVPHGSSLTVHHSSINTMFKDELFTRVRARRDSDDDAGLPQSPCNSPTTVDVLSQGLKEKSSKSQKTCSVGSLISMGSSENDEDSAIHSSGHSSKMSLLDRRSLDSDGDNDSSQPVPLNHNAAHHKIAIKPKRTYGLPRRRMNQIAAAKVRTLPSTPEITEDIGKSFQKHEVEIVKTFTEYSVSSLQEISSKESAEKEISQFVSYAEASNSTSEISSKEKLDVDSSVFTKCIESSSKTVRSETIISPSISEIQNLKSSLSMKDNFTSDKNEENLDPPSDSKPKDLIENTKTPILNEIFEAKQTLVDVGGSLPSKADVQITSSSLVKSIDAVGALDPFSKSKDTKPYISPNDQIHFSIQGLSESTDSSERKNEAISTTLNEVQLTKTFTIKSYESFDIHKCTEEKVNSTKDNIIEVKNSYSADKLNIDNEFVLKPIQRRFSQETSRENSQSPALYFGEESLTSSSLVSAADQDSETAVLHPSSLKNNLNEMLVTEAHNFAAVEESVNVLVPPNEDVNLQKKKGLSEPWISSVNISSSDKDEAVNSISFSSSKMTEDLITISVNKKSEVSKSLLSSQGKVDSKKQSDSQKPAVMPKLDGGQKLMSKDKQSGNKPISNVNTNSSSSKSSAQKRVSVEIVPFSQRVKERKYQPISYSNKETSDVKKNPNVTVERKLSDRKVVLRNKDTDKSVNRHSFSGALVSENKKGEIVIEKKTEKPDKVQYPVQIRIHKSKPDASAQTGASNKPSHKTSVKNANVESNPPMPAAKLNPSETKLHKDETSIIDNATKWEVKIQPSVSHSNNLVTNSDESVSPITEKKVITKDEVSKSDLTSDNVKELPSHSDSESGSIQSQENSLKGLKETSTVPDDPEPELLRVFARRSIKQKHSDKGKSDEQSENLTIEVAVKETLTKEKLENPEPSLCDNVVKISEVIKPHAKPDLKKKSKSFCEKEKSVTRSVSPLREMNLIHRESLTKITTNTSLTSETLHPRQRLASVPDIPLNMPPDFPKDLNSESPVPSAKEENALRTTASVPSGSANGNLSSMVKENQDLLNDKEPHAPSWLQLAQQRRELREQRERLLLGGSPNSFMDGSNKPSRSSKVWDMVNNFQKLQMT